MHNSNVIAILLIVLWCVNISQGTIHFMQKMHMRRCIIKLIVNQRSSSDELICSCDCPEVLAKVAAPNLKELTLNKNS